MSSTATSKKRKSKGAQHVIPKPKRPMSAYNYFFREKQSQILAEDSGNKEKKSFQDIGRIIGQRWRQIDEDQLQKYNEMAKADKERYTTEMDAFRKKELELMCSGGISLQVDDDGDKKPAAEASSVAAANPPHPAANATVAVFSSMSIEQLMELRAAIQRQGYVGIDNEQALREFGAAKAFNKAEISRVQKELEVLHIKDQLLSQLMASCLETLIGGGSSTTGSAPAIAQASLASMPVNGFGHVGNMLGGNWFGAVSQHQPQLSMPRAAMYQAPTFAAPVPTPNLSTIMGSVVLNQHQNAGVAHDSEFLERFIASMKPPSQQQQGSAPDPGQN